MAFVLAKKAKPGDAVTADRTAPPPAPGAVSSPQVPGQVPDRSSIPGEEALPVPPGKDLRRPITEYGTAQRIMHVYAPRNGNEDDPARFEQAPISYQEQRKAYPVLRTPTRPTAGYALTGGVREPTVGIPALEGSDDAPEQR